MPQQVDLSKPRNSIAPLSRTREVVSLLGFEERSGDLQYVTDVIASFVKERWRVDKKSKRKVEKKLVKLEAEFARTFSWPYDFTDPFVTVCRQYGLRFPPVVAQTFLDRMDQSSAPSSSSSSPPLIVGISATPYIGSFSTPTSNPARSAQPPATQPQLRARPVGPATPATAGVASPDYEADSVCPDYEACCDDRPPEYEVDDIIATLTSAIPSRVPLSSSSAGAASRPQAETQGIALPVRTSVPTIFREDVGDVVDAERAAWGDSSTSAWSRAPPASTSSSGWATTTFVNTNARLGVDDEEDPVMVLAREQSLLDEAARASLSMQRQQEEDELAEAMRLSLRVQDQGDGPDGAGGWGSSWQGAGLVGNTGGATYPANETLLQRYVDEIYHHAALRRT
ncbi:hypothetical protein IAT38_003607 [Cryptococcus sp. DSM 104549]